MVESSDSDVMELEVDADADAVADADADADAVADADADAVADADADAQPLPAPPLRPPPIPIPQIPHLPLSTPPEPAADGPGIMTCEEAAVRRNEIAADAMFSGICHWVKFWDTASPATEASLRAVTLGALDRFYGKDHPARKSIERAKMSLFTALRHPKMPFNTTDIERAVRDVVHPERQAHRHIRCPEAADASSKATSFTGTCMRNGLSPMQAFRELLHDPEWSIFERDRPPPKPPP